MAAATLQLKNEWEVWKRENGKSYADDLEESLRHAIWFQNYHYIHEHNKKEPFSLGLNEFSDLVHIKSIIQQNCSYLFFIADKGTIWSEISATHGCRIISSVSY